MRRVIVLGVLAFLTDCSGSGYTNVAHIPVIDLTRASPDALSAQRTSAADAGGGLSAFRSAAYSGDRIRRGDTIAVTIFSAGEEGLFSAANGKTLELGHFTVEEAGSVNMPFVGRQLVQGQTPEAVQARIVAALRDKAIVAQAVVKIVDSPNSAVTISGGVHQPGRQPLKGGDRVLDVIARAGGAGGQPSATTVTLIRDDQRADVGLERILGDPLQNVYVQPDDEVVVGGSDASFTAFGRFKNVGEFRFAPGEFTLAQALGRTGGPTDDGKGDVYLIRNQRLSGASTGAQSVAYRINLKDGSDSALMQQFEMRNGDVLTTNADSVQSASSSVAPQSSGSAMPGLESASALSSILGVSAMARPPSVPSLASMPGTAMAGTAIPSAASVPGMSSVSSLSATPGLAAVQGLHAASTSVPGVSSVGTTTATSAPALSSAALAAGSTLPSALRTVSPSASAPGTAVASIPQPEMVPVAGGTFRMGSGEDLSEQPIHPVTVKAFQIAKYPVTIKQWNACVAAKVCGHVADGADDAPMSNLSWNDAEQFVAWLSQVSGRHYRLPSEAEWEYAARGGSETRYWWGNTMRAGLADCKGCGGLREGLQPDHVGALPPNPFGLNDIGGGIAEWVEDCWHRDYRGAPADGSAWLAPDCRQRVLRGGSWGNDPSDVRSASRDSYDAGVRYPTHGLRLALSP